MLDEQVDKRREWRPLRRAPSYDLPAQRDTSKPPFCYRHTRKAHNLRRVCPAVFSLFLYVHQSQPPHSDNRATGLAFSLNPLFHPDASGPTATRTVRGTRLVVLSAGSFGTPGILERSGIGAKGVLDSVGVKQRVDLPGVGENYQGPVRDWYQRQCMILTLDMHRSQHFIYPVLFVRRGRDIRRNFPKRRWRNRGCVPLQSTWTSLRHLPFCSSAATAEFAKTGKGLIASGYVDISFFHFLPADDHNVQHCRRGNQVAS